MNVMPEQAAIQSSTDLVAFRNVSKTYDSTTYVVRNLNLSIPHGEFMTLLGPSGSGKTTTLMMLAGFEQPSAGEIMLAGTRVDRVPPHRRGIGVVFQNYALFPHMTVAENLAFPLQVRQVNKSLIASRIDRMLELVNLAGMQSRRPEQLSGGQQQRVALARAMIFNPTLVLMDEPLGALDKQLREQMQYEIKRIQRNIGVTVVYVTHDQSEALTMSDRIAIFNGGMIHQLDTPKQIYEHPANAFVAQFVGENNRLCGRTVGFDSGATLVDLEGGVRVWCAPGTVAPGRQANVFVRPEKVKVGGAAGGPNLCRGIVEEVVYFGDHTTVVTRIHGSTTMVARLATDDVFGLPSIGANAYVSWRPEDALVLPE